MSLNVKTVQGSFEQVKPIANKVVERFFENLSSDYPALKPVFGGEMNDTQRQAFLHGFVFVVDNLNNQERLSPYLRNLSSHFKNCGVQEKHYEWCEKTLLKSLSQFFGDNWNADLQQQWGTAFNTVANWLTNGMPNEEQTAKVIPFPESSSKSTGTVVAKSSSSLSLELPPHLKTQIREEAKRVVREAIQSEIEAAIKEELESLGGTVTTFFKKAVA